MSGMLDRARRTTAVGAVGVLAFVATGCTMGGDDGDSLTTDDGGEAAATVAGAVDDARAGTGRFLTEYVVTDGYSDEATELTATGAFSGDAYSHRMEWDGADASEEGYPTSESSISVDGRDYDSIDQLRSMETLYEDLGELEDQPSPYEGWNFRALDGKDWVEVTDRGSDDAADADALLMMSVGGWFETDPFTLLGVVTGVVEQEPQLIGDLQARHFTATIPPAEVLSLMLDDELLEGESFEGGPTEEELAENPEFAEYAREHDRRQELADRYVEEHTTVTADLYLDPDDRLLRASVSASTEIAPEFEDCYLVSPMFESLSFTTSFTDLGEEIVIAPPDPSTVLSLAEVRAALPTPAMDESFAEIDEPLLLETVDGPRDRYEIVDDLAKFGHVIGLGPDPWTLDVTARGQAEDAVSELADGELVARYAELDAALAAMPHTSTRIGELTRPELLWNTKWGLDDAGGDIAVADGLGDAEIGALIDGFVEHNGGPAGDGVFGALPDDAYGQETAEGTGDEEYTVEDEFEGCPA